MWYEWLIDSGLVPDFIMKAAVKAAIRPLSAGRRGWTAWQQEYLNTFAGEMAESRIAPRSSDSRIQHYEVPTDFFRLVLGSRMKYSCCLWDSIDAACPAPENLDRAEKEMLQATAVRAGISDGMDILDLGCGWGSFALFAAEKYRKSLITAVSHSATQRQYIEEQAEKSGLVNLRVITADMNDFETDERFDRIVSIEMFEHMRNWKELLGRINTWLKPGGALFIHIFNSGGNPWFYDADSGRDWMARYFFAGGMMPSSDLLFLFTQHFDPEKIWKINGIHYSKTLDAWLKKMDSRTPAVIKVFKKAYGKDALKWKNRWRLFFLSCSVFFSFRRGNEWYVTHYLLRKRQQL